MTVKRLLTLAGILALGLLLAGCTAGTETDTPEADTAARTVEKTAVLDINDIALTDDASLYADQDPTSLQYFYITVKGGNAADDTDHTFAEVNSYINLQTMYNVQKIKTEILLQIGDEYGPLPNEIGYSTTMANATMNVRGRTSTLAPQKSYRIDLFSSAGLWRGQRAIALNKHPYDATRLRNMLYFTLLQRVPSITSLRTQFVQVFIKDETAGETAFSDYGLFTQVEIPNGRYLRNHSLSRNGDLYKANYCELYRYEDKLRLATDPLYDPVAFNTVLEPKTSQDHTKLLAMLDDVNDYAIPIEQTVETYFNVDNITSYLAYNILMGNLDTNSQNYLLYSPVNSQTWYFLCWDGDGCLTFYEDVLKADTAVEATWQSGISNYWNVRLFNRMFRVAAYRDALVAKVDQLRAILTPDVIAGEIAKYRTVVDTFTGRMPDMVNLTLPLNRLELIYQNMPYDVEKSYRDFNESLKRPMPFFLGNAEASDGLLSLRWSSAYSFADELVYYTLQIATDWSFSEDSLVYDGEPQLQLTANIPMPAAGNYCWRITAQNESGYTQMPFDRYTTGEVVHYGMRYLRITDNGEVQNPQ